MNTDNKRQLSMFKQSLSVNKDMVKDGYKIVVVHLDIKDYVLALDDLSRFMEQLLLLLWT